jgi:hypothetical protein
MRNNRRTYLLIFTLAVTAVLLRPFLAYQLTESQKLTKDPVALNSLLQRLIKKKDDHHYADNRELAAAAYQQRNLLPPPQLKKTQFDRHRSIAVVILSAQNTVFKISPGLRCYALHAQFRI